MGKHCFCSHVRSPIKHVITSIASLSFFGLNVDKWSLVCWSVTLAGIRGDSLVGSHTSALADTSTALWISGWARLWVCSRGRSQSHSGFGQDKSLYVCSGLHLCFWGHRNFLEPTWALEAWDRSQHAFSEQDVCTQHGRLLENQRDTEAVQAMALFKGLMEKAVFSHQPALVRKHQQETPFPHSFRLEHYVFKLPILNFNFSWNGDLLTKY